MFVVWCRANLWSEDCATVTASQNPKYEGHEKAPILTSLGLGAQFTLMATATLMVTPVIVANESGRDESYLTWMVFASLLVVGVSTLLQVRRLGPVGAGAVLPMFTAAVSIPFCITAVVDGGPATLTTLVLLSAIAQLVISKWLVIMRRIVTPTVSGIVIMILSITLASVVFQLLDDSSREEPTAAPLTALITLVVVAALTLRGAPLLRLWGPVIGIVVGTAAAAGLGIYDASRILDAPWVGVPSSAPGLGLDFGIAFWTLVPSFLFLGVIFSIQANGEAIAIQRASLRENRAIDFRQVQGALAGGGASNLMAGLAGTVPNIVNSGIVSFVRTTGVASRSVGYCAALIFIAMAFLPKVSAFFSTIPGPVMTGYLLLITGILIVDGARTIIQNEPNREKVAVAGICFWIGAAFQFKLFALPELGPVVDGLFKSGITTGGFAAVAMILYLELTNPRRMRFQSRLHIDSLPDLNEFISRFANSRGWGQPMMDRLSAVAEETLLTLAPLDLGDLTLEFGDLQQEGQDEQGEQQKETTGEEKVDDDGPPAEERRLVVVASSDGPAADLEFIGGASNEGNIEDRIRQMQQHDSETPEENEMSLRLLRGYASSVRHQQYHGTDIITVRVLPPDS